MKTLSSPPTQPAAPAPALLVEVRLPDDQLLRLADLIHGRLSAPANDEPVTVTEACKRLRWSRNTMYRRIEAGLVTTVPNAPKAMIPAAEMRRLLGEKPQPGGNDQ